MAGFTPLEWVDSSLPYDGLSNGQQNDEKSMVSVVEELLRCRESFQNKSSSYKKLRGYIREGLCPVLRPNAWKVLSGGDAVLEHTPSLFDDIHDDLGEFVSS